MVMDSIVNLEFFGHPHTNRSDAGWRRTACGGGKICVDGACLAVTCVPGNSYCADAQTLWICNELGTSTVTQPCEPPFVCQGGACAATCIPGTRRCDGTNVVECGDDWVERLVEACDTATGPATLAKIPASHPLYSSFFKFPEGPPQTSHELNGWGDDMVHDYLRGVERRGRLGVIYSNKDYGCEWDYDWRNKRFQRDDNTRFAVNIVVYAMGA